MFPVELCPEVMRNFGLVQGAKLMETWFSRPPAVAPYYSAPVANTITMDWVLKFSRAKDVYEQLIKDQIWTKEAAQIEIGRMLQRKNLLGTAAADFNDLWRPLVDQDDDYVNERPLAGYQGIDDLTAALGAFNFRVLVAGSVSPVRTEYRGAVVSVTHDITLKEVGVYVRDSYDFEGDQFLGWWTYPDRYDYWREDLVDTGRRNLSYPRGYILAMPFEGGDLVANSDFRKYRKQTNRGGDFLVFSDIKRTQVWAKFSTDVLIQKHGADVFAPTTHDMIRKVSKIMGATIS